MDEKHDAQAQEPEPESKVDAQAIDALLQRGWNDTRDAAERFIAEVGADVILDMHAKKPRNIGAGYFRKYAHTWRISKNGDGAEVGQDAGTDAESAAEKVRRRGLCPKCYAPLSACVCVQVDEVRESA